jgi:hypothetical protein
MRDIYTGTFWPCAEEASFTAYFLRTQPSEVASGLLKAAMADRERGCYQMLLAQVAQVIWNPIIEAEAMAMLKDSDPDAAKSAATVLAGYTGPEAEPLLWKRLELWSGNGEGGHWNCTRIPLPGRLQMNPRTGSVGRSSKQSDQPSSALKMRLDSKR